MNIIIKMKKNPIDDLFAKKLAEHRQEPSQKAFEKFQARLSEKQQKHRGGVFFINRNWAYYAAAAGVVAALTWGILLQKNHTDNDAVLANNSIPAKVENKKPISIENTDRQAVMLNDLQKKSFKIVEKPALKEVEISPIITNQISVAKLENSPKITENIIVDDSPIEQTSVALNQIVEAPSREISQPITTKSSEVFKNSIDESIVLVLEPEQDANEVIPSINEDSATPLSDVKRLGAEKEENAKSFIAKLYGEYKHFKYGEKVDLKKIGVKDVLARVDENFFKEDREDAIGFVQRKLGRLQKNNDK